MALPLGEFLSKVANKVAGKLGVDAETIFSEKLAQAEKGVKLRSFFDNVLQRYAPNEIRDKYDYLTISFRVMNGGSVLNATDKTEKYLEANALFFKQNPEKAQQIFRDFWRYGDAFIVKADDKTHPLVGEPKELLKEFETRAKSLDGYGKEFTITAGDISDKAGEVITKAEPAFIERHEARIIQKLKEKGLLEDTMKVLKLLDEIAPKSKSWSIWNLYYPHVSFENFSDAIEKGYINTLYPHFMKYFKPFFAHERTGGSYRHIEDPLFLWRTMLFQSYYWENLIKEADNLAKRYDIFNVFKRFYGERGARQEIEKFLKNPEVHQSGFERPISIEYLPKEVADYVRENYGVEHIQLWDTNRIFRSKFGDPEASRMVDMVLEMLPPDSRAVLRQRYYAIPHDLAQTIKFLENEIYGYNRTGWANPIRKFTHWWKVLVTIGFPMRFMVNNFIGDFLGGLALFHPEAIKNLNDAQKLIRDLIRGNLETLEAYGIPEEKLSERLGITKEQFRENFLSKLKQSGIAGTIGTELEIPTYFGGGARLQDVMNSLKEFQLGEVWKNFKDWVYYLNTVREATPRIASMIDNLVRVEKGEIPVFRGAPEYIRKLSRDKEFWLDSIVDYGNWIHVDYSIRPQAFRKWFGEFLFPFSYWYVSRLDSYARYITTKEGALIIPAMLGGMYAATYAWNHRNEQYSKIYDNLPPFYKYGAITIIGGVDENKGTPTIFRIVHPFQTAVDLLGWNHWVGVFNDFKEGRLDAEAAAKKLIFGEGAHIYGKVVTLLNPIIQGFVSIGANKDYFTGKQIVPEQLRGTSYENEIQMRYLAERAFLSPILPLMQSQGYDMATDILEEYGYTNPKGLINILLETGKAFVQEQTDIRGTLMSTRYLEPGVFLNSAIYREAREMTEAENEIFERIGRSIVKDDWETVRQIIKEAETTPNYPTTPSRIAAYLDRTSTQLRYLEAKAKKIKDKEKKEEILKRINDLKMKDYLLRRSEKTKRSYLIDRWNSLYETLTHHDLEEF
jgi:hypothetical protein